MKPTAAMSDVEFIAASKVYEDGTVALDELNLKVGEGEFLVLLGPSGCGKSTALRLLAGLEDISRGEIRIGGSKVNDLPPGARGLGMVFQSYALYPHMTVGANLAFGLRRGRGDAKIGEGEIASRVAEAAEMLDLGKWLDKKPRELSGGQQQRVAIGRALVRRPKVLLMDEPLSNLDAKLRNRMRFELRRLHEAHGTTTLYVTHDQVEAMTLADRVAILSEGRLQQSAKPLEAYHRPANSFVASFLGTPAMNLIEGAAANGVFTAGQLRFTLPPHLAQRTGPGIFGVRPEDLRVADGPESTADPAAGADSATDSGTSSRDLSGTALCRIGGVERLGGDTIYHLQTGGHWIRALWREGDGRTAALDGAAGGQIRVRLAVPSALIFEE